jgi:SAM-dependent methyltransferase
MLSLLEEQSVNSKSSTTSTTVTSSELVLFCQGLRQGALQQVRANERKRRFFLFFVLPLVLAFSFMLLLSRMSAKIEREMIQLGLLSKNTCNTIAKQTTQQTCHLTDSAVFRILYNNDPLLHQGDQDKLPHASSLPACLQQHESIVATCSSNCINPSKYAMHLIFKNETISLEEVINGGMRPFASTKHTKSRKAVEMEETVVNALVRQSIVTYSDVYADSKHESVLDFGCGLGSTLYSLMPLVSQSNNQQTSGRQRSLPSASSWRQSKKNNFQYKGVSLGTTEVQNARRLANHFLHGVHNLNFSFVAGNFDDPSQRSNLLASSTGSSYSTIVAVESLSYSANVPNILTSFYKALPKGGLLIVVDDVVLSRNPNEINPNNIVNINSNHPVPDPDPGAARVKLFQTALLRPSLLDHTTWMDLFSKSGFQVLESRDLTVEYELLEDSEDHALPLFGTGDNLLSGIALNTLSVVLDVYDNSMLRVLMRFVKAKGDGSGSIIQRMSAWLRLMLLRRGDGAAKRLHALRKRAYRDAELRYNIYVAKKI